MPRRITVLLVAVVGLCLVAAAPAAATERVVIRGGTIFNPGESVKDNVRFTPRNLTVRSGERVRVRDRARIGKPRTRCRSSAAGSFRIRSTAAPASSSSSPTRRTRRRRPSASRVSTSARRGSTARATRSSIPPGGRVSFRVTADEGRNLSYLCAVHPWMQGQFKVR